MTRITSHIELSGPLFERDIRRTMAENIRSLLEAIAKEAEADIRQQLEAGEAGRAPIHAIGPGARVSHYIRGRVESLSGRPWHYNAVISPDRTGLSEGQAIALYAAASQIEKRSKIFARTSRAARRFKADLARGLN